MLSLWLAAFRLLSSYLAIRNGCVSTATVPIAFKLGLAAKRSLYSLDRLPPALRGVQRLSNCISAWPYGQAHAFLSFGPLTARVARRVSVPQLLAITMLSLCGWPHLHDCLQITLRSSLAVCPHSDCIIAFQLGLAAKRSLYHLDRLPPALRGVQRLANCILAWPYGQACFLSCRPAQHRPGCTARQRASSIAITMLSLCGWPHLHDCLQITLRFAMAVYPHSDCFIAFQLGLTAKRSF